MSDIVYKFEIKDGNLPEEAKRIATKQIAMDTIWAIIGAMWELRTEGPAINLYLLEEAPDRMAVNTVYHELQSFLRFCVFNSQINLMLKKMARLGIPLPSDGPIQFIVMQIMEDAQNYIGLMDDYGITIPDFLGDLRAFHKESKNSRWSAYVSNRPEGRST